MEHLQKDYSPSIWSNSLCQCLKTELASMATWLFWKWMFYSIQMTNWFTEVPSDKSITCLCHDVSAEPADDQHHMHDLHVSSTLRCQQGSLWFLHLTFLLQNTENEIQHLGSALLCHSICRLAVLPLSKDAFKIDYIKNMKLANKIWNACDIQWEEAHAFLFRTASTTSLLQLVSSCSYSSWINFLYTF